MDRGGFSKVVPVIADEMLTEGMISSALTSGYVQRCVVQWLEGVFEGDGAGRRIVCRWLEYARHGGCTRIISRMCTSCGGGL